MKKSKDEKDSLNELFYGFKPIEEVVRQKGFFEQDVLYIARRQDPRVRALLTRATKAGCEIKTQSYQVITTLVGHDKHQGIALQRAQGIKWPILAENQVLSADEFSLYLALDGVQDPRNLGAVVRTAVGLGCRGLILAHHGNAPLGATALKASAGALLHLPILYVSGLPSFLLRLHEKNKKAMIIAASSEGEVVHSELAAAFIEEDRPVVLVVGGEQGLKRLTQERCDLTVRLPIADTLESYNLSVAAAMLLYEFLGRSKLSTDTAG